MGLDDRFIYHPLPFDERAAHALLGGLSVEEHSFPTTDDLRLHGWIARTDPAAPWLLWCHGNAGNISHRADNLALLVEHGLNVFIFDYRGYGRSEGRPSEPGFYADAAAAYDYLRSTAGVTPAQIVLYGRSLGAPVAAELALRRPAAGLILEAPLGSITAMARTVIPLVPLEKLFRARFDTLARAPRLQLPDARHGRRARRRDPAPAGSANLRGPPRPQGNLDHSRRPPQQHLRGRRHRLLRADDRLYPARHRDCQRVTRRRGASVGAQHAAPFSE